MRRFLPWLPNLISSIRILLVVPIAMALARHEFTATLWLFAVAAASDAVDGFLAKQFGWQTDLGGILDPVADKLMLVTVFVMLALLGLVPVGLTVAVIARDGIIVLGAIGYRVVCGPVKAHPSIISKLNTLCQIAFILDVIGTQRFSWPSAWSVALGALVLVTVCVSGIDYVLVYGRLAAQKSRSRLSGEPGGSKPA